jgi:hypothetical protein
MCNLLLIVFSPSEADFSINVPQLCSERVRDAPFAAITNGGVPQHSDIRVGACGHFLHIVVRGEPGEEAYFAVPRRMASPGIIGPRGLAHLHLVSGAIGVVDQIVKAPGVASCLSINVLADAVTCASPLELVPYHGVVSANAGAASAARNLSSALRSAEDHGEGPV